MGGNLCNHLSKGRGIQHTAVAVDLNNMRKMGFLPCRHKSRDCKGFQQMSKISLFEYF